MSNTLILSENDAAMKRVLQNKLDMMLTNKGKDIQSTIQQIERTGSMLNDFIVDTKKLRFDALDNGISVSFNDEDITRFMNMNEHSIYQLGSRLDPKGFPLWLKSCLTGGQWEKEAAAFALNQYALNHKAERFLVREVEGTARAFLSDSYKRLNTMQIFVSFLEAAAGSNCVLVDGHTGESRDYLEIINPDIRAIQTPNNGVVFLAYGARLRNSDFGDGALSINTFKLQPVCMNGAVGRRVMNEVHLGARLPESIVFANDTVRKDTEARALMVRDSMRQIWKPEFMDIEEAQIIEASERTIDVQKEVKLLPKLGLQKFESDEVLKVLIDRKPEDGVAGTPSLWSLAQAVGAVARDKKPERMRELQEIAGNMIFKGGARDID
jgi:hypothetical protein